MNTVQTASGMPARPQQSHAFATFRGHVTGNLAETGHAAWPTPAMIQRNQSAPYLPQVPVRPAGPKRAHSTPTLATDYFNLAVPHAADSVAQLHAQLNMPRPQTAWKENINAKIGQLENRLEKEMGTWGLHGCRYGAVFGMMLAGISTIVLLFLPLLHVTIPAAGVILGLTLASAGFAIGLIAQATMRKKWQLNFPESRAEVQLEIDKLRQAILKHEGGITLDDIRALRSLELLEMSLHGGFVAAFWDTLAGLSNLDPKMMYNLRKFRKNSQEMANAI